MADFKLTADRYIGYTELLNGSLETFLGLFVIEL